MKKYIAEFIGTFFLVLTIGLTVIGAGRRGFDIHHWRSVEGFDWSDL